MYFEHCCKIGVIVKRLEKFMHHEQHDGTLGFKFVLQLFFVRAFDKVIIKFLSVNIMRLAIQLVHI